MTRLTAGGRWTRLWRHRSGPTPVAMSDQAPQVVMSCCNQPTTPSNNEPKVSTTP